MSRYIVADVFIENLNKDLDTAKENGDIDFMSAAVAREFIDGVSKDIKDERLAPYIDIVRCKECRHWDTDWIPTGGDDDVHWCSWKDLVEYGDWFCADGERKEGK